MTSSMESTFFSLRRFLLRALSDRPLFSRLLLRFFLSRLRLSFLRSRFLLCRLLLGFFLCRLFLTSRLLFDFLLHFSFGGCFLLGRSLFGSLSFRLFLRRPGGGSAKRSAPSVGILFGRTQSQNRHLSSFFSSRIETRREFQPVRQIDESLDNPRDQQWLVNCALVDYLDTTKRGTCWSPGLSGMNALVPRRTP